MKEDKICEAKYGDSQCNAKAATSVISNGELFTLHNLEKIETLNPLLIK